jgi:predicted regulator of Ras-like GTPase activity (Roadblock/LC7/MglB family)
MTIASPEARSFNWLLDKFAAETAGVSDAIAVSADGLLIAVATEGSRADAERFAAITSAITSLASGASRCYHLGATLKIIIDYEDGYLLVATISAGSALGVLATKTADLGTVAYEMAVFTNRAGRVLTPELVDELKSSVAA